MTIAENRFRNRHKVGNRTRARELAMQAIYQLDVQGSDILGRLDGFFAENEGNTLVRRLASKWSRETWEFLAQCDSLIQDSTIRWDLSRLSPVDKSILRLSVYQLKFCDDIPPKVIINEAVELAKKYSSEQAPGFVNGVLDAILKKLEQQNHD